MEKRAVIENKAELGIAFDGDADRIGAVDENGKVVSNWDIPTLAGAGALRSSAEDMLRFLDANLAGATHATLTLDYDSTVTGVLGTVSIQVSTNNGGSWTVLNGAPPFPLAKVG